MPGGLTSTRTSRRDALRIGGLGAAGLTALALVGPSRALAQSAEEEELRDFLEATLELERGSVLSYGDLLDSADLDAAVAEPLELLRDQEQAHANALANALDSLGFEVPGTPESVTDIAAFEGLAGPEAQGARGIENLIEVEELLISSYLDLAPALESEDLSRTALEIAASHAQHAYVLRKASGDAAADALERIAELEPAAPSEDDGG